jgi:hypothetical protein
MEAAVRMSLSLIILVGMTIGALQIDRAWLEKRMVDLWDLPANYSRHAQELQRGEEINTQTTLGRQRAERKRQIALAVLEGRLSLTVAADQFFEASKDAPYEWDVYVERNPHWSLRMRCAHLVIDDVRQLFLDEGKDPSKITADLRRQVAAWEEQ